MPGTLPELAAVPKVHSGANPVKSGFDPTVWVRTVALIINSVRDKVPALLDREAALSTPFHLVPVLIGLGAVLYFTADFEPEWTAIAAVLGILALLRIVLRRTLPALILNAALLVTGGTIAAKLETVRHEQTMLAGELSTTLTGKVISTEKTERGSRVILELASTRDPKLKFAPTQVRIALPKSAPQLTAGTIVDLRARLQPPGGPVRPDAYDFAFNAWFSNIGATGFAIGPVTMVSEADKVSAAQWLEHLRASISERVRTTIEGEAADVAAALITGVQAGISRETAEAMRISGLAHVLSISGLHMALAAAIFLFGIRGAFALFPAAAQHLPVKKIAAVLALASCTFYLALSGAGVATVRSWIMIAVMLIAILLDRPALTMRNLAIAAILILVMSPHEVMGPSFQLSFAATAALIAAYGAYTNWRSVRQTPPMPQTIAGKLVHASGRAIGAAALTSLVAGLATTLFSTWHFNRLAPLGLPANLASMVPVSIIIMPSAVFAMLLMPFGLDSVPLQIMGYGVKAMNAIAHWFASISPDISNEAMSLQAFVFGAAAMLVLILSQTRLRLIAVVPALTSILLMTMHDVPDMLISEDGKLIAVRMSDGQFATNRRKMPQFTGQVWAQALGTTGFVKPIETPEGIQTEGFVCRENICRLSRKDGLRVIWHDYPPMPDLKTEISANLPDRIREIEDEMRASFQAATQELCDDADLLIINGPSAKNPCNDPENSGHSPIIVTAKELAIWGSAEIRLSLKTGGAKQPNDQIQQTANAKPQKSAWTANIQHAITDPTRPWHRDRAFSRAARNMAPFRPIRQKLEELQTPPDSTALPDNQ